jgi:hypothetical protein
MTVTARNILRGVVASEVLKESAALVLTETHLVNEPAFPWRYVMRDLMKKFVVNRLLYMLLLTVLCLGIFPFCTLFPFTMWIGKRWDSISSNKTHAKTIEGYWDKIGKPYDYLVKLVD